MCGYADIGARIFLPLGQTAVEEPVVVPLEAQWIHQSPIWGELSTEWEASFTHHPALPRPSLITFALTPAFLLVFPNRVDTVCG